MAISHVGLAAAPDDVCSDDPLDLALEAYTFAYPLLVMDATRRVATSVAVADCELGTGAPTNQFSHLRRLLGAELEGVLRPSLDTLYSFLWFDVAAEPLVVSVPDSNGRFYSLSLLDHWSDVFASPGARTTGTGAQTFAITAPSFGGSVPGGVRAYQSPTTRGWLLGLTQVRGVADVPEVARFQAGMRAVPWSAWQQEGAPDSRAQEPSSAPEGPGTSVLHMTPNAYFARFCELTRTNPPHAHDGVVVDRLRRIGIAPGRRFVPHEVPRAVRGALEHAKALLPRRLEAAYEQSFRTSNHWRTPTQPRGVHGNDYLVRAGAAHAGVGAHASEDAVDFTAARDSAGAPLRSARPYTLTFRQGQLPPVRAFWSLTLYDDRQKLVANANGRHALGSGDDLLLSADGSLTLYLQRERPGDERERNWLPTPEAGDFSLSLRLYWPGRAVVDRAWNPPPVLRGASMPAPGKLWFARDRFEWSDA
ncbi:MAG TPA: DUF1254 domain-containing protein [Polyangiaceae bacterium]|nr:DUF1254 domain-containing protein [Polyangiaceae bacterium]